MKKSSQDYRTRLHTHEKFYEFIYPRKLFINKEPFNLDFCVNCFHEFVMLEICVEEEYRDLLIISDGCRFSRVSFPKGMDDATGYPDQVGHDKMKDRRQSTVKTQENSNCLKRSFRS